MRPRGVIAVPGTRSAKARSKAGARWRDWRVAARLCSARAGAPGVRGLETPLGYPGALRPRLPRYPELPGQHGRSQGCSGTWVGYPGGLSGPVCLDVPGYPTSGRRSRGVGTLTGYPGGPSGPDCWGVPAGYPGSAGGPGQSGPWPGTPGDLPFRMPRCHGLPGAAPAVRGRYPAVSECQERL